MVLRNIWCRDQNWWYENASKVFFITRTPPPPHDILIDFQWYVRDSTFLTQIVELGFLCKKVSIFFETHFGYFVGSFKGQTLTK
jgi:hypothetical protein